MNKMIVALFLVGFWLFLPIGMQLLGVSGYDSVDNMDEINQPTGLIGIVTTFLDGLTIYFNMLIFNIPNVHEYIVYFIRFLQFASLIFIVLVLAD